MPRSLVSLRSRRVSSAAITSAPASSAAKRGGASSTRPIGVPASTSTPVGEPEDDAGELMGTIMSADVTSPRSLAPVTPPDRRDVATLSRTARGDVVPTATERAQPRAWDPDKVIAWAATVGIASLAGFLRLFDLQNPKAFLFDETYYAKDGWSLVHHGYVTGYVSDANSTILDGNLPG